MMMTSRNTFILIVGSLLLSMMSCTSVSFNQPQPVDSKNLKRIPKKLRGTWVQKMDTIIIGKRFYQKTDWHIDTISRAEIEADTSLEIRGQRIYVNHEDALKGFEFTVLQDSLIVKVPDRFEFTLGDSAQLRRISKRYAIINLKKDSIWWDVHLVEYKNNGGIIVRHPKKEELHLLESLLNRTDIDLIMAKKDTNNKNTAESHKYWDVGLTSRQLMDFINQGGFSGTSLVLEPHEKISD
ncbi:hypothetical protein [Aestuariivivens sediminis]|uniref:hypothetical protein n=1 Tax=Aestuariivivens sediminis TaxID=2913557 RepID=UPI001F58E4F0|nr:hypothetical protein [Aestuariivivens sediminis]